MKTNNQSTEILKSKLLQSENIDEFIHDHHNNLDVTTFNDYLYKIIDSKNIKISEALQMSQMSESYGYQLFNGKRQPSRDKVIQLSIGLNLNLLDTNRLLLLSGKSELYVKDQRDAVLMFAINKGWTLFNVESLLMDRNLDCLIKK